MATEDEAPTLIDGLPGGKGPRGPPKSGFENNFSMGWVAARGPPKRFPDPGSSKTTAESQQQSIVNEATAAGHRWKNVEHRFRTIRIPTIRRQPSPKSCPVCPERITVLSAMGLRPSRASAQQSTRRSQSMPEQLSRT